MDKSITTLVADIKELVSKGKNFSDTALNELGEVVAKAVQEGLSPKPKQSALRMSNFAMPDRKLWYTVNQPELAEPLPPEARIKFLYGHIIEAVMLFLAEQSGHSVKHKQKEVTSHGVVGHIDAVIDGCTVDVKSAGARSFGKFRDHLLDSDDPFGYRDQLSLYVESVRDFPDVTVKGQGAFLAVDKELGNIVLDTYSTKKTDYEKETIRKRAMLSEPNPPPRCYVPIPDGKSGNLKLGVECSYCPFKHTCWASANGGKGLRTFIYSTGPRYLTHVEREPDVPEQGNGSTGILF